jgi:hypothetical protein
MNKLNTKFWVSENLHSHKDVTHLVRDAVWWAVGNKGLIGLMFVEGTVTEGSACSSCKIEVIQGAGHVDITFFQHDGAC